MNMKSKSELLVFLEFVDEAEVFLKEYVNELHSERNNITIIAFHPLVKSYLLKQQIKAKDSFHFCPTESHRKLLCVLEDTLRDIRKQCSITDENGVTHAYVENLIFRLRAIISHILYRIEVITNALSIFQPKTLVSVGSQQPFPARSIIVEAHERYIAPIVSQVCAVHDITQQNLELHIPSDNRIKSRSQWSRALFFNLMNSYRERTENLVVAPSITYCMGEVLADMVVDEVGDFNMAVMQLPKKKALQALFGKYTKRNSGAFGYVPCNIQGVVPKSRVFEKQKIKLQDSLFKIMDDWIYDGVLFGDWLKNKYQYGLAPGVIDATYHFSMNQNRYLDRFHPVFVLSQHSRMPTAVLGELCKLKKIPSMMIPHGTFAPLTDEYSKKEWVENALGLINTPYEYVALQTPLAQKFISDVPVKSKPVITGPLLFGRANSPSFDTNALRKRYASDSEKIVLHAGTPKERSSTRLLNYETLDEYVDGMVSLANVVSQLEGVRLIIRFRPIDGLTPEDLKTLLPKSGSYLIASDGDFASYLSIADLLVSFSSTTIEEALLNNIPVLLYNKYNRYNHISGMELSPDVPRIEASAVYNINREDDLHFGLDWILKNHLLQDTDVENLFNKYQFAEEDCNALSSVIKKAVLKESNSSATVSELDRTISPSS
jgi:hypothetical protein